MTAEAEIGEASWEMATPVGEMVDAAVADMGGQTAARTVAVLMEAVAKAVAEMAEVARVELTAVVPMEAVVMEAVARAGGGRAGAVTAQGMCPS